MLREKLVVIDDIERKHSTLSIDEILGFIDEFTKRHGARFLLILNSDKLSDSTLWTTMREKVIDQELKLKTTPEEAFSIASKLVATDHGDRIAKVTRECGVTNIRIVCKVIKTVNAILGTRTDLSESVLNRTIPSAALMSCVHYKGIDDGPDLDFVLKMGTTKPADAANRNVNGENKTEQEKRESSWRLMLSRLGIIACDEYEYLLVDFLESGMFDATKLSDIIQSYMNDGERAAVEVKVRELFERLSWDVNSPIAEICNDAKGLFESIHLIDCLTVTAIHEKLSSVKGGESTAREMITRWVAWFSNQKRKKPIRVINIFDRPIHPEIVAAFAATNNTIRPKMTPLDVCMHVSRNEGWGREEVAAMASATVEDFEHIIRKGSIDDRRYLCLIMIDWAKNKGGYQSDFSNGIDCFLAACRNIVKGAESGRLGGLIRSLFSEAGLAELLD